MSTKEEIKNQIADLLGLKPDENPPMSTGSTEPKRIFELVDQRLGLSIDPEGRLNKHELAKAIVVKSGQDWHDGCESEGGTVTKVGLLKVLFAVSYFTQDLVSESGPFTPEELGIENDYAALSTGNTGGQYECAIAALLMPPHQLEEFRDVTIARRRWGNGSTFDLCFKQINPELINKYCLPTLPHTDRDRYIECAFQNDKNGPSDIVVHDLRTKHMNVGISIKHDNNNIKNPSPIDGLGMDPEFLERQGLELRRITPDWITEMTQSYGDLQYPFGRRHTWYRKRTQTTTNFFDRIGAEVMPLFNKKPIEERVRLTRALLHLDHNPLSNFFILKTKKSNRLGYFIDYIIKQHHHNFACKDPTMMRLSNSLVQKRIFDKSGIDPIGIDIQVKCNNGFAEHKKNNRRLSPADLKADPSEYFPVASGTEIHVLKYGSLTKWNVAVGVRPSEEFWEYVYES